MEYKDRVRLFLKENGIRESGELDGYMRESIGRMQLRGREVGVPPAAAVTPEAVTPGIEVHMSATQMPALPASPQTVALIHANKRR